MSENLAMTRQQTEGTPMTQDGHSSLDLTIPLQLPCGAVLANRLAKGAMTEGLGDAHNRATERHERLFRRWSASGAGLLITGNIQIDRDHLERPGNVAIDGNDGLAALRRYAAAGTSAGNHLWMQINHPGRQTLKMCNPHPLAPSAVPLDMPGDAFGTPRAMSEEQVLNVIDRFEHVARVAQETGFTGVEIHAAHGYLLSQFLSPLANRRNDRWGGSLENRARLMLEVVRRVRRAVGPSFPVGLKMNSADFQKGGFSNDEAVRVVSWLNEEGLDLLELSGGTYEQPRASGGSWGDDPPVDPLVREREAYFLEYAAFIKKAAAMPVMVTGGFRTRAAMMTALAARETDLIGLARPFCVAPDIAGRLLRGEVDETPMLEQTLALAPDALGPEPDPDQFRQAELWGKQGWFCVQLLRMGDGLNPDVEMTVFDALRLFESNEIETAARLQRNAA